MARKFPRGTAYEQPFAGVGESSDILMQARFSRARAEMDRDPGYSWNQPQETGWERFRRNPFDLIGRLLASLGITFGLMWVIFRYVSGGFVPPPEVVYVRGWQEELVRTTLKEQGMAERGETAGETTVDEEGSAGEEATEEAATPPSVPAVPAPAASAQP